jgi:tetratricopeptide (TPR) repeat protein
LALLVLVLYNPVTRYQFVNFDDDRYVTDNPHVTGGLSWSTLTWAFESTNEQNWHPLTWLSHALDCQLFHLNPAGHHYVNLLIHTANVLLLFLLLQSATGCVWRSFFVAALFGVHPINVESVVWIAERKNVLCTFFFLLTLGAYGWYARSPNLRRYLLVTFLFILGLMSKPMVVTLPFILLLMDYWPLRRIDFFPRPGLDSASPSLEPRASRTHLWSAVAEKLPLLGLSAASAMVTMKLQEEGGAVRFEYSRWMRLGNAVVSYVEYLAKSIFPHHLAVMYPHPGTLSVWAITASALILLTLTIVIVGSRPFPYLVVGWFWFLGTLVPVIGLVQVGMQSMADRYAYIPFIGLFVMASWGVADWAAARRVPAKLVAVSGLAALVALSAITRVQESYWHDSLKLWSYVIRVTGPNFVAQDNLACALGMQAKYEDAVQHFRYAAQINPQDPLSQLNIGASQADQGNLKDAIRQYQLVLDLTPDRRLRADAFSNLGVAYRRLHDYARARSSYESALRLRPDNTDDLLRLGIVQQKAGDLAGAIERYSQAVKIRPSDVGYLLLAQSLEKSGRFDDAKGAVARAQDLSRDLNSAKKELSELLSDEEPAQPAGTASNVDGAPLPATALRK